VWNIANEEDPDFFKEGYGEGARIEGSVTNSSY
jgi:hypothetical protein